MKYCFCQKDADGECLSCRTQLQDTTRKITEVQLRALLEVGKLIERLQGLCESCGEKYLDYAISKVIEGVSETDLVNACGAGPLRAMVVEWENTLKAKGVMAFPLMTKAWEDVCAKQGWDPKL